MRLIKGLILVVMLLCFQNSKSQLYIGATLGVQVPGMQDLKFREFDTDGHYVRMIKTSETHSTISLVKGLNVSYWFKKYGLKLDYLYWNHNTVADKYIGDYLPSISKIREKRQALHLVLLRRFKIPFAKNNMSKSFSFVGAGYGFAKTIIQHGLTTTQPSLQVSCGFSFLLTKNLNAVSEFKYVLTSDVDNRAAIIGESTIVDTSGSPVLFRNGAHFDTRYHMFLFGLQYQLF
ncbi:MAG: hypothetical protein QM486_05460 [Flavobacteriaceae bacterium]